MHVSVVLREHAVCEDGVLPLHSGVVVDASLLLLADKPAFLTT